MLLDRRHKQANFRLNSSIGYNFGEHLLSLIVVIKLLINHSANFFARFQFLMFVVVVVVFCPKQLEQQL